jgi:hypothetical protein
MPADREQWSAHNVITPQEHLRFCGVACSFTLRPGERVAGCTQIDVDEAMASRLRTSNRAAVVCLFQ